MSLVRLNILRTELYVKERNTGLARGMDILATLLFSDEMVEVADLFEQSFK